MQKAIGHGDVKQAVENVLKDRLFTIKEGSYATRIGVETGHILLGKIVKPGNILRLIRAGIPPDRGRPESRPE
jgi:hypothetical protein